MVGVQPPDARRILDTCYDSEYGRLAVYADKVRFPFYDLHVAFIRFMSLMYTEV